jgi:hypothetical protein
MKMKRDANTLLIVVMLVAIIGLAVLVLMPQKQDTVVAPPVSVAPQVIVETVVVTTVVNNAVSDVKPETVEPQEAVKDAAAGPDWNARKQYWVDEYSRKFRSPASNVVVKIGLKNGNKVEGTVVSIDEENLRVHSGQAVVDLNKSQLDDRSRMTLFKADYVDYFSSTALEKEKQTGSISDQP